MNEYHVPETHEEVVAHFKNFPEKFMGECMLGIYEIRIAKGESVMLAYENALRAGIGQPAIEAAEQSVQRTADPDAAENSLRVLGKITNVGDGEFRRR